MIMKKFENWCQNLFKFTAYLVGVVICLTIIYIICLMAYSLIIGIL